MTDPSGQAVQAIVPRVPWAAKAIATDQVGVSEKRGSPSGRLTQSWSIPVRCATRGG